MATITAANGEQVNLANALVGNGVTTNIAGRRRYDLPMVRAAMLRIVTTIGATPTCTYLIEGSADGAVWWPMPNVDLAAVGTLVDASFVITTAATFWRMIPVDVPWTFLRVTLSANTNVTNTIDMWIY